MFRIYIDNNTPGIILSRHGRLDEVTNRELLGGINREFLKQGMRAKQLQYVKRADIEPNFPGTQFVEGDVINFSVPSSRRGRATDQGPANNITYLNQIKVLEWQNLINDQDLTPIEAARIAVWVSDLKLYCSCPSFLYFYQYILTQLDASLYPENRFPKKTNPELKGIFCKHLNRTLKAFPFYSGDLAKEIKSQREMME